MVHSKENSSRDRRNLRTLLDNSKHLHRLIYLLARLMGYRRTCVQLCVRLGHYQPDRLNRKARKPIHNINLQKSGFGLFVRAVFRVLLVEGSVYVLSLFRTVNTFSAFFLRFFYCPPETRRKSGVCGRRFFKKTYDSSIFLTQLLHKVFSYFISPNKTRAMRYSRVSAPCKTKSKTTQDLARTLKTKGLFAHI